jgi:multidrug efflux system outer membrane protein
MRILFFIIILTLSACSFAPDYFRPEVELPKRFVSEEQQLQTFADSPWWNFFSDPVLKGLIAEALEGNKDALIAASRIEQARAQLGIIDADLYPRIDIAGSATRQDPSDAQFGNLFGSEIVNTVGLSAELSYQLDFWGRYRNLSKAAQYQLLSTEQGLITLKVSLLSQVARAYFTVLDFENQKEVGRRTLDNRKEATKVIKARFEEGILPELDFNQAQIEEADAAVVMIAAERGSALARNALATLLGKTSLVDTQGKPRQFPLPNTVVNFPDDQEFLFSISTLQNRPDVLATENLARAALAQVGVAKADRLPNISLLGSVGYIGTDSGQLFEKPAFTWDIGGQLLGPLIDFGKARSGVELAVAQAQETLLAYENSLILAAKETEDSIVELKSYKLENEQRNLQVKAAINASSLSRARYFNGFTSYLEVLDIERSLFQAELSASSTLRLYYSSIVRLYEALGGGWVKAVEQSKEMKIKVD